MEEGKKKSKGRMILIILLLVLSSVLIAFIIISPYVVLYNTYENDAKAKVESGGDSIFKNAQSSIVYDKDGNEIARFRSDIDKYYVMSSQMDDVFKQAFVALVDKDFFEGGYAKQKTLIVIVKDTDRAAKTVKDVSPVTRLMARDIFLSYDIDKDNSVIEVFVANELQKAYTREQIFEYYVNNIYFNNGYYGVEAAARGYLGKDISELTTSEKAFLAAVAEDSSLDPYTDMDSILVKRNVIVTGLLNDGIIDNAEYYRAISEKIVLNSENIKEHNYLESYVVNCVVRELMEKDGFVFRDSFESTAVRDLYEEQYTKCYTYWYRTLFTDGYRIYTSIDMDLQDKLQNQVDNTLSYNSGVNENGDYRMQGAVVCIDNGTGNVIAIVGGRSTDASEYAYNHAFQDYKPAGNVITPLNVYTPFIEWHHNPEYIVYQEEAVDGTLINKVTLREAILKWNGDFAQKVYENIGPSYGLSLLSHIGFAEALNSPAKAADYGNVQITALELAAGYATLANDGAYRKATCIVKVTNAYEQSVYSRDTSYKNVYAANDSRIMTEILAENMTDGYLKSHAPENAITAALTSTSDRGRNAYMAGYSRLYTVAVWSGYSGNVADNEDMSARTLADSTSIWKYAMEYLHKGEKLMAFEPSGPYSKEPDAYEEILQPTTERPSLGGIGGHPEDGDDYLR